MRCFDRKQLVQKTCLEVQNFYFPKIEYVTRIFKNSNTGARFLEKNTSQVTFYTGKVAIFTRRPK
jgi:hypothetical protein